MKYSLVSTVLNDDKGLMHFLKCMRRQTRQPDEIVIVDGGSRDGTWERLLTEGNNFAEGIRLMAFQEPGCNVARGRNLAIQQAKGRIIVSTDIGCDWDEQWFEELVSPFEQKTSDEDIDVVIGSWAVRKEDCKTRWAMVEYARRYPFRLEATPDSLGINRSIAYKKEVFEKVGGYSEDLTLAADDVVFDMLIRKPVYGFEFAAAPIVRCYWERHETLSQFCREEKRNFYGAGEAGIWKKHFMLVTGRLLLEFACLLFFIGWGFFGEGWWPSIVSLFILIMSVAFRLRRMRKAVARLKEMGVKQPWRHIIFFDYMTRICGMWGYAKGLWNGCLHCANTRHRLRK